MRLIDADRLTEEFLSWTMCDGASMYEIERTIDEQPTVDAEPVRWAPVVGYEGLYEVNEFGHIRNQDGRIIKQRLKKAKYTSYKKVSLYKDGKYKHLYVRRIVAQAFLENPNNAELINHKDEDGTNNWVKNLEWCNRSYNATYGNSPKRISKAIKGRESEKRKAVLCYRLDGAFLKRYPSITEAAKDIGGQTTNISAVCSGKRKNAYGYLWKYDDPNCGAKMDEGK